MQPIDTNNVQSLVPYKSYESTASHPFEDLLADIRDNHIFPLLRIKDFLHLGKTNKNFRQIISLFDISKSVDFSPIEFVHNIAIKMLFKNYVTQNYLNLLLEHLFTDEKDEQYIAKTIEYFLLSVNRLKNPQIDQLIKGILSCKEDFVFNLSPKLNQSFVKILESQAFQGSEIAIDALLTAYKDKDFGLTSDLNDRLAKAKIFADKGSEKAIAFLIKEGIESVSDENVMMENIKLITEYAEKNSENAIDFIVNKLFTEHQEKQLNYIKYQAAKGSEKAIEFLLQFYGKKDQKEALSYAKNYAKHGSEEAIAFLLNYNRKHLDKKTFLDCAKDYADKGSEVAIFAYLYKNRDLEIDQLIELVTAYADLGSEKALDFLIDLFRDQDYSKENQNKILDFIKLYADKNAELAVRALLNPFNFIIDRDKHLELIDPKERLELRKRYAKQGSLQALSAFIINQ